MKKNNFETILYSTGGVIALLVVIVGFNVVAAAFKQRLDLTAERAFTLSRGTRAILAKLDTPVKIRLYYSQSKPQMPVALKNYAQHVIDLLDEYRQASKGKIEVQRLDPEPDSDEESSANLDGVQGEMTPDGDKLFLGVATFSVARARTVAGVRHFAGDSAGAEARARGHWSDEPDADFWTTGQPFPPAHGAAGRGGMGFRGSTEGGFHRQAGRGHHG
jgi:hypothetical protein